MYKKFFVILAVYIGTLFLMAQNINSQTIIASDEWNQHEYTVVAFSAQNWENAKTNVNEFLGSSYYLATIVSQEEENFIISLLLDNDIHGEYWIGGYQTNPEAEPDQTWTWVTGENMCYTNWGEDEPNDWEGNLESHLGIWDSESYSGWKWNDEHPGSGNIAGYIAEEGAVNVLIDIKPGSDPNSINCKNENGVITVAILTTTCFDATLIDHTTVTFEGAIETHINKKNGTPRRHEEDVDNDGDMDLVFHFRCGDTDLSCISTMGVLTGETFDGITIQGQDNVRMVKGNMKKSMTSQSSGDITEDYILFDNFPNPFNPETEIRFQIPESEYVIVRIFNTLGKEIRELTNRKYDAGYHNISWDGKDDSGNIVPSGLYLMHLQAGSFSQIKKMTLLK